jgi:hypothetical protein
MIQVQTWLDAYLPDGVLLGREIPRAYTVDSVASAAVMVADWIEENGRDDSYSATVLYGRDMTPTFNDLLVQERAQVVGLSAAQELQFETLVSVVQALRRTHSRAVV